MIIVLPIIQMSWVFSFEAIITLFISKRFLFYFYIMLVQCIKYICFLMDARTRKVGSTKWQIIQFTFVIYECSNYAFIYNTRTFHLWKIHNWICGTYACIGLETSAVNKVDNKRLTTTNESLSCATKSIFNHFLKSNLVNLS